MLSSNDWLLNTNITGQYNDPALKDQAVLELFFDCLTLEYGMDR